MREASGGLDSAAMHLGAVAQRDGLQKLRPGPGLPAGIVIAHQRHRLRLALIELVDEVGFEAVTVRALTRRAGVSTRSFYKHFENVDACLGAAYRGVIQDAFERSASAQESENGWTRALRASISNLMDTFAGNPRATRLALVEIYGGGPASRRDIGLAFGKVGQILAASFAAAPRSHPAPRLLIEGMAAGVIHAARRTTLDGRCEEMADLVDEVVRWTISLPHPDLQHLQLRISNDQTARRRREVDPFPADGPRAGGRLDEDDRSRLLRAARRLAAKEGLRSLTVPMLRADAGVSRRRFDELFDDATSCFLEAVEETVRAAAVRAETWALGERRWELQTSRLVLALAAQAARDGQLAQITFREIHVAGRAGLLKREAIISQAAAELRQTVPPKQRPSAVAAEASIAAAWHIAQVHAAAGRSQKLPHVAPLLAYVILAPIVGGSKAAAAVSGHGGDSLGL